jgi:uncharacterized metal-binding protein YceD (DUF177 family)
MKKIRPGLDGLRVVSFEVRAPREERTGTVRGYISAGQTNCQRCSEDAICTLGRACTVGCPPVV